MVRGQVLHEHEGDARLGVRGRTIASYRSYADLVVHPSEIIKGRLQVPTSPVHVELPWPNNAPIDELARAVPKGSRIIIVGRGVETARSDAVELAVHGGPTAVIADNLVSVPAFGLVVETQRGAAAARPSRARKARRSQKLRYAALLTPRKGRFVRLKDAGSQTEAPASCATSPQ
jgi:hypothetical protein